MLGPRLERLRTLSALAHCTPGATLHIECANGEVIVAGSCQSADLSTCQLRRVFAAQAAGDSEILATHISSAFLGGALEPWGPGIYRDCGASLPSRRFASLLGPLLVEQTLGAVVLADPDSRRVRANLQVDEVLGVTCVQLRGDETTDELRLDEVTLLAAAEVSIEEAVMSAAATFGADFRNQRGPQ